MQEVTLDVEYAKLRVRRALDHLLYSSDCQFGSDVVIPSIAGLRSVGVHAQMVVREGVKR